MQNADKPYQPSWPTLEGRLRHALTSRVAAVRQLQTMMPLTPLAQRVLQGKKNVSSRGQKKING